MLAEFYLIPDSFASNGQFSKIEIEEKIRLMASDFIYIKKYSTTNKFYIHHHIYSIKFIDEATLGELISDVSLGRKSLSRDVYNALIKIIVESQGTQISTKEVIEVLLPEHNETICHGLIAFHRVLGITPEFQIVYNRTGWLDFRRHYLALYPREADFFISECVKYFPKLFFHERTRNTVGQILKECPKKLVYHLVALNDLFNLSQQSNLNRSQVLHHFSVSATLDDTATLEGNAKKKPKLTFQFQDKFGSQQDICCEPHIKLCYNDAYPGDSSYSTNRRIYFHEGSDNIHDGKILIGHIGNHL